MRAAAKKKPSATDSQKGAEYEKKGIERERTNRAMLIPEIT